MKIIHGLKFILPATALLFLLNGNILAQCTTWAGAERAEDAKDAFVLYKEKMSQKQYAEAFKFWKTVYEVSPSADGTKDDIFVDGAEIHKKLMEASTSEDDKAKHRAAILQLYSEAIDCINNGGIKSTKRNKEQHVSYIRSLEAYDMFYFLRTPYPKLLASLEEAVTKGGNKTEYIVFTPYASAVVYQFKKGKMDAAQARAVHEKLNAIADHNAINDKTYGDYYKQAQEAMNGKFAEIEDQIFDCNYFKGKFQPQFKKNPKDYDNIKYMIAKLTKQGCKEEDPFLSELNKVWITYTDSVNAVRQAEFEANNPAYMAKKCFESKDYNCAISKYEEAMGRADVDDSQAAEYLLAIASIKGRNQKKYGEARTYVNKALNKRPGWGKPYMLLGDLYASSSRSCGSDAYSRGLAILAAINKYSLAKNDPEYAEDAQKRINNYMGSRPPKEDVFLRGTAGKSVTVPCWIGEKVTVPSYK